MRHARLTLVALLLALLVSLAPPTPASAAPVWSPAAPTQATHFGHNAVLLPSGEVLLVGGYALPNEARTTERYDPTTNRWRTVQSPRIGAGDSAATLLGDGQFLIYGPSAPDGSTMAAERYDPATDTWSPAASPPTVYGGSLTALPDGRALLVSVGQAAVYTPATDTWTPTGPLSDRAGGYQHTATPLRDGRVLVTGGIRGDCTKTACLNATAERYDPATNAWTAVTPMIQPRANHRATLLPDGQVLVVGNNRDSRDAERYDPATDTWTAIARLPIGFITGAQSLTTLPDSRALLIVALFDGVGGYISSALLYIPATDTWEPTAALGVPRSRHTATILRDGRVLVVGGDRAGVATELYGEVQQAGSCFAETGQCLAGSFLSYWQANGGLAQFGYPITAERWEVLEDGKAYVVQYFERARFEHHPENQPPYDVLLGQFGRSLYPLDPGRYRPNAARPLPGATYFEETGHNLAGRLLAYWEANGGLAQFGFPLSEEITERLEDGNEYTVQYFERARLEYHPANAAPYDVLLGQSGRRILAAQNPTAPTPYPLIDRFAPVYASNQGMRVRLNAPTGPATPLAGAALQFQRGWMLYRADTRTIYAFLDEGDTVGLPIGAFATFPDTWDEGQPPGGGPGPGTLFEPSRGFGKVWRENETIRNRLGYALAPSEQGLTFATQPFVGGLVLDAPGLAYNAPRGATFLVYTNGRYEIKTYAP